MHAKPNRTKGKSGNIEIVLPQLPYAEDELEPYISAQTVMLHHGKQDDASYRQSSIAIVGSSITAYLREIGIGFSQAAATPAAAQAQDEKADGQKGVRP